MRDRTLDVLTVREDPENEFGASGAELQTKSYGCKVRRIGESITEVGDMAWNC